MSMIYRSGILQKKVNIDGIVLLCEDESPCSTWKMARVINTIPSADSVLRKVTVKVSGGQTLDKPVQKLITLLPTKPNQLQGSSTHRRKLRRFREECKVQCCAWLSGSVLV